VDARSARYPTDIQEYLPPGAVLTGHCKVLLTAAAAITLRTINPPPRSTKGQQLFCFAVQKLIAHRSPYLELNQGLIGLACLFTSTCQKLELRGQDQSTPTNTNQIIMVKSLHQNNHQDDTTTTTTITTATTATTATTTITTINYYTRRNKGPCIPTWPHSSHTLQTLQTNPVYRCELPLYFLRTDYPMSATRAGVLHLIGCGRAGS